MWTTMKKLLRLNLDDFGLCAGVMAGAFLLIHVATAFGVKLSGEGTSLLLSGVALPVIGGILMMLMAAGHVMLTFDQALRFGQTRRRALALTMGQISAEALLSSSAAAALAALERAVAPALWMRLIGAQGLIWGRGGRMIPEGQEYAGLSSSLFVEEFSLDWWWMPVIVFGGAALGFMGGAIVYRFGRKGGWGIWGLWMLVCLALPHLRDQRLGETQVLFPLLGIAAAAVFVWSLWLLLRAAVKN